MTIGLSAPPQSPASTLPRELTLVRLSPAEEAANSLDEKVEEEDARFLLPLRPTEADLTNEGPLLLPTSPPLSAWSLSSTVAAKAHNPSSAAPSVQQSIKSGPKSNGDVLPLLPLPAEASTSFIGLVASLIPVV